MTDLLSDIIGYLGVLELLVAYALVSTKKIEGDSAVYQLLNLVGSASLIVNSLVNEAYPSVVVNIFWIGIAAFALIRVRRRKR
jgi:hypothetical protein